MTTRTFSRVSAAAVLGLLALAGPARADLVYDTGDSIVVSHDDGSSPTALVTLADTPQMKILNAPAVNPHGTTVVFEGIDSVFDPRAPAACGDNCTGVYEDAGGSITRLTPLMPGPCNDPCALIEGQPEIGPSGQIVASYLWADYVSFIGIDGFPFWDLAPGGSWTGLTQPPHGSPVNDASPADIPTPCSGHDISVQPQYPSLSADGAKLVYVNCTSAGRYTAMVADNHGNNATVCRSDDAAITDPSFSLDGSRVVDAEGGDNPGLWDFACPSGGSVYALAAPAGVGFQSPRYDGSGRIVFVAVQGNHGDAYAISAACGQGGTPCRFPQDATPLTHRGDVSNLAWTSATIPVPSPPGQSPVPSGGGTSPSNPASSPAPVPATAPSITRLAFSGSHLLRFKHGLPVVLQCSTACSGRLIVTVSRAAAKRAHLGRRAVTLASGTYHAPAGKAVTVTLKVSRARVKALRHARSLAVTLTAGTRTVKATLRR